MQLVEIQDDDILWIIKEPTNDHVTVNPCLARKASEFVPAPSRCNRLLDKLLPPRHSRPRKSSEEIHCGT
jgi:hypothetical protein